MMTTGLLKRARAAPNTVAMASDDVLVARQPILDRDLHVRGYELLYRAAVEAVANVSDAERATSRVIADTFGELGLERLVGGRPAFVNVTREFLLSVRPLPFAPGRVVLELLENQGTDPELLDVLHEVVDHGFAIALDDFVYDPSLEPLLDVATIVKIDVLTGGLGAALEQLPIIKDRGRVALAEKVETHEQFELLRDAGFDLFQGFFYARPKIVRGQRVPSDRPEALSTLADLESTNGEFDRLEEVIRRDVGLSYKLLRYVNSAFIGLPRELGSVRDALTTLGARTVKQWATVLVLAGVSGRGKRELIATGLVRARICEQLVGEAPEALRDRCFTVGMFSVIDALLDVSMETALAELPLVDQVLEALLNHRGIEGRTLVSVLAYERGDFDAMAPGAELGAVAECYGEAVAWADAAATVVAA
jgi:EAL and modified HD-GYP domain-containing signal transduction protein